MQSFMEDLVITLQSQRLAEYDDALIHAFAPYIATRPDRLNSDFIVSHELHTVMKLTPALYAVMSDIFYYNAHETHISEMSTK